MREDPTLALAQLLLETRLYRSREADLLSEIAGYVASFTPGAQWVQTARLLEAAFGGLKPDAKQFIVDRVCMVLMEFGAKESAEHLRAVPRFTAPEHAARPAAEYGPHHRMTLLTTTRRPAWGSTVRLALAQSKPPPGRSVPPTLAPWG
ncbi:hypothetical protein ACFTZK_18585 [Streptomyces decoyicus]|uniref:hypothetical protein n=1 Tax=Streptomyces decoyicus TaxID=249567 RepID=UPI0036384CC2